MMLMMIIKELFHAKDVQKVGINEKKKKKNAGSRKNNGDE